MARPLCRASELGVSGVAGVFAGPVKEVGVGGVRAAGVAAEPDEPVAVAGGAAPAGMVPAVDDFRAPPELRTTISPGRFSGRRRRLGELFVSDGELVADGVSDDDEPESGDDLDGDDPPDDEPVPASPGAANAAAGVLATAIPTPTATANAHMPPMCSALPMVGFPSLTRAAFTGPLVIKPGTGEPEPCTKP